MFRIRIQLITLLRLRIQILLHFDADPDPEPTFHYDADPDADPDPSFQTIKTLEKVKIGSYSIRVRRYIWKLMRIRIRIHLSL
jgi:hypothetical protein